MYWLEVYKDGWRRTGYGSLVCPERNKTYEWIGVQKAPIYLKYLKDFSAANPGVELRLMTDRHGHAEEIGRETFQPESTSCSHVYHYVIELQISGVWSRPIKNAYGMVGRSVDYRWRGKGTESVYNDYLNEFAAKTSFPVRLLHDNIPIAWANGASPTTTGDTMNETPNLSKPLNLGTAEVIKRLEKNLQNEQQKRADAEKKTAESRKEKTDLLASISPDQLYNLVTYFGYTATADAVETDIESKRWDSPESIPTETETDIEKFIRVLKMSKDETVEVLPTAELYRLL